MDFQIIVTLDDEESLEIFDKEFQRVVSEVEKQTEEPINIALDAGDEDNQSIYLIKNYHHLSEQNIKAIGTFLGEVIMAGGSIATTKIRTEGFGEDMPRWSHENGHFVDNRPWEKW